MDFRKTWSPNKEVSSPRELTKHRSVLSSQISAAVRRLQEEDWTVLYAIEHFLSSKEVVPTDAVAQFSNLHEEQVRFRLDRLSKIGFIVSGGRRGVSLVSRGLDAIALYAFAKTDVVVEVGPQLGIGKEADVFLARNANGEERALKFYRIGRTSFRSVAKTREYATQPRGHRWLHLNILAAKREFECLRKLEPMHVNTPKPFARERHAIAMEFIDGVLLSNRPEIRNPKKVLREIIDSLNLVYTQCRIINGDLSEFNILFDGEKAWILDWPQAVSTDHPNALALFERDIENVVRFFKRTYNVSLSQACFRKKESKR